MTYDFADIHYFPSRSGAYRLICVETLLQDLTLIFLSRVLRVVNNYQLSYCMSWIPIKSYVWRRGCPILS